MNKVYLVGEIIDISELKFFYNSKKHNSQLEIKIKTFESNIKKSIIINMKAYDEITDIICKDYKIGEIISIEGQITGNMEIEIRDVKWKWSSVKWKSVIR